MELRDYVAALRRHWRAWVGVTLLGVLAAVSVVQLSPREYQATAGVFVASTLESTSGSQFVNQRVRSYPEIARSMAVLSPVIETLDLDTSVSELRAAMTVTNPADTSQIDVAVTSTSAEEATRIANAVAEEFSEVVEVLETPAAGAPPVDLTVTDPATVPGQPVSPNARLILVLGLVAGLFLGLALAVLRSRLSTLLHSEEEVRDAWGEGGRDLVVHARQPARLGHSDPATLLTGQLEVLAEDKPLRLVALPPAPGTARGTYRLLVRTADQLTARGVTAAVSQADLDDTTPVPADSRVRVRLLNGERPTALRDWRRLQQNYDGVVLVLETGRVREAELAEFRVAAQAAGIRPLAVLVVKHRTRLLPSLRRARRVRADVRLPAPSRVVTARTGRKRKAAAASRPASDALSTGKGLVTVGRPPKSRPR